MFGLFKKKTTRQRLLEKYKKLMSEAHRLSTINRASSDAKFAEAEAVLKMIDALPPET